MAKSPRFRGSRGRYRKPRTVKRPKKRPEKCHVIRIRPDHLVMTQTAARMTCAALKHGASKAAIDRAVQIKCNVGAPACDCERVLLTLRQVLVIEAFVTLSLVVLNALVLTVPLILTRVPLLGRILLRLGGQRVIRQLTDQSKTIEGVFTRVRDDIAAIERDLAPR